MNGVYNISYREISHNVLRNCFCSLCNSNPICKTKFATLSISIAEIAFAKLIYTANDIE